MVNIYTDGSCHPQLKIGCWAAVIIGLGEPITIHGLAENTTHNRMELTAVLEALEYHSTHYPPIEKIQLHTDSQYVMGIPQRSKRLKYNHYLTAKGTPVQNSDLIKLFIEKIENFDIKLIKVKAHQKQSDIINYNREVDKLVRKKLREHLRSK